MTPLHGFILGLIQGLTEFLPVSSSGHLIIGEKLFGFSSPPTTFDIFAHLATLISVVWYFRKRLATLSAKSILMLFVGSIPAGIAGVLLEPKIEWMFDSNTLLIGGFVITGVFMIASTHLKPTNKDITAPRALTIGLFQAFAILPSVSRSGSTVFGALLSGVNREEAFAFSFLLSIPAIGGAALLHVLKSDSFIVTSGDIVGFVTAAISGLVAIKVLGKLIKNNQLYLFGYYCLLLAGVLIGIQ